MSDATLADRPKLQARTAPNSLVMAGLALIATPFALFLAMVWLTDGAPLRPPVLQTGIETAQGVPVALSDR